MWGSVHYPAARESISRAELRGDVPGKWLSQHGQDRTVAAIAERMCWRHPPFFVDLAANHPFHYSNTRALERDLHWRGLCIEANPSYLRLLAAARNCTVVGAAIAASPAELTFTDQDPSGRQHATNGHYLTDKQAAAFPAGTFKVSAVTFASVLAAFAAPREIGYLSLDIEGAEAAAMSTFPWEQHAISMLTVERPAASLVQTLLNQSYVYACNHGTRHIDDRLYVHRSLLPVLHPDIRTPGHRRRVCSESTLFSVGDAPRCQQAARSDLR